MLMEAIGMPMHPGQLEVYNGLGRFNDILNGRRWGKTALNAMICLKHIVMNPSCRGWCIAPQHLQNKEVMRYLDDILNKLGEPHRYYVMPEHKMVIGKALIECRSGDNPTSMRGAGLDFAIIDEACYIRDIEMLWNYCLRPALADRQGSAYLTSSPNGDDWVAKLQKDPKWCSFSQSTYENPFIPREELDALKDELPPEVFDSEIMAKIVKSFGLAFPHQIDIVEALPEGPKKYALGVDWGWANQFSAVCISKALDGKTYVEWEVYEIGLTPQQQAQQTVAMGIPEHCLVVADASTFTSAGNESIADQWRRYGLIANPATRDRKGTMQLLREMLRDGMIKSRFNSAPGLVLELKSAKIDPRNREDITGADHSIDALRYALAGIHLQLPKPEPEVGSPEYYRRLGKLGRKTKLL